MNNYLIDRMIIASPKFNLARQLKGDNKIIYTVIEEIGHESRHDKQNSGTIQRETFDNLTYDHVNALKDIVPEMIEMGVVKPTEGCGDAMLVAEYKASLMTRQTNMFEEEFNPIIVTDDKKLLSYCKAKNIKTATGLEFFLLCGTIGENS